MNKYEGHTKGPWSRNVPPASHYVTVWAGRNNHVGRIDTLGKSPEECEANLNLIADAPKLLAQRDRLAEALRRTWVQWCSFTCPSHWVTADHPDGPPHHPDCRTFQELIAAHDARQQEQAE